MTKKRRSAPVSQSFGFGVHKNKKLINEDLLVKLEPLTDNQKKLFDAYDSGKNIIAHGVPGVGKTMVLFYKALKEVLNERTPYDKVYVARSAVATRNLGFIPGTLSEKISVFEDPYKAMVRKLFNMPTDADFAMLYGALKNQNTFEFMCTSYLRGITLEKCIVIVDEFQNLSFGESFTILTRCGMNSKIMFAGDIEQSDFTRADEKRGVLDFLRIVDIMPSFERIEFGVEDILRSPLVKEFIIAKKSLGL